MANNINKMAAAPIVQRPLRNLRGTRVDCDESGSSSNADERARRQLDVGDERTTRERASVIRRHEKDIVLVLGRDFRTARQFLEQPLTLLLGKGRKHALHERFDRDRDGCLSAVTETCHDRRLFFIHNDPFSQLDLH